MSFCLNCAGHNTSGVWIYRLDTCSERENNYRALCYAWMRTDSVQEQSEVNRADSLLPACPCNTVQAALDDKFVQTVMESNCYFVHPSPVNTNYTRVSSLLLVCMAYRCHDLTMTGV